MRRRPLAPAEIINPVIYEQSGYPYGAWATLRREAPMAWCEADGVKPFWAMTRLDDIVWLSRQTEAFAISLRMNLNPSLQFGDSEINSSMPSARPLLNSDPPNRRTYRKLATACLTPRAIEALRPAVRQVATKLVDEVAALGGRPFDFVTEVASVMPIEVIAQLLGIPLEDRQRFFRWMNEIIAPVRPDGQQASRESCSSRALQEMFSYFSALAAERQRRPASDLISQFANDRIGDSSVTDFQMLSYLVLLIGAGNETTRNAASGAMLALTENPSELDKLRRDPRLLDCAIEEMLRWTSPVIQFCRTATRDVEIHGCEVAAGEDIAVFYPSANRDERHFEQPSEFRVDRQPNHHIAFGSDDHFCLGAHLARMELQELFGALTRRLDVAEAVEPVVRLRSSFVGGIEHLQVRLELDPRRGESRNAAVAPRTSRGRGSGVPRDRHPRHSTPTEKL